MKGAEREVKGNNGELGAPRVSNLNGYGPMVPSTIWQVTVRLI